MVHHIALSAMGVACHLHKLPFGRFTALNAPIFVAGHTIDIIAIMMIPGARSRSLRSTAWGPIGAPVTAAPVLPIAAIGRTVFFEVYLRLAGKR